MVKLTMIEELKLEVIQRVMDNQIDISKAAQIAGLSYQSIYRLLSRVRYYFILGFTPRWIRGYIPNNFEVFKSQHMIIMFILSYFIRSLYLWHHISTNKTPQGFIGQACSSMGKTSILFITNKIIDQINCFFSLVSLIEAYCGVLTLL